MTDKYKKAREALIEYRGKHGRLLLDAKDIEPILLDVIDAGEKAEKALVAINEIRNSIIGFQTVNWSEHIYPLVAALDSAGIDGLPYEEARKNVSSLIERAEKAEQRVEELEGILAEATTISARIESKIDTIKNRAELAETLAIIRLDGIKRQRDRVRLLRDKNKNLRKRAKRAEAELKECKDALVCADSILSLVAHRNSQGPLTEENRTEMLRVASMCRELYESARCFGSGEPKSLPERVKTPGFADGVERARRRLDLEDGLRHARDKWKERAERAEARMKELEQKIREESDVNISIFECVDALVGRVRKAEARVRELEIKLEETHRMADRLRRERSAALNLRTSEGLTATEWILRVTMAEAERDEARALVGSVADESIRRLTEAWERGADAAMERDQLRERVGELEEALRTIEERVPNDASCAGQIARAALSRPLAEPHESAPGAELEPVDQPVTTAAEPAPADVAPPEPEPGVGADIPGDAS